MKLLPWALYTNTWPWIHHASTNLPACGLNFMNLPARSPTLWTSPLVVEHVWSFQVRTSLLATTLKCEHVTYEPFYSYPHTRASLIWISSLILITRSPPWTYSLVTLPSISWSKSDISQHTKCKQKSTLSFALSPALPKHNTSEIPTHIARWKQQHRYKRTTAATLQINNSSNTCYKKNSNNNIDNKQKNNNNNIDNKQTTTTTLTINKQQQQHWK